MPSAIRSSRRHCLPARLVELPGSGERTLRARDCRRPPGCTDPWSCCTAGRRRPPSTGVAASGPRRAVPGGRPRPSGPRSGHSQPAPLPPGGLRRRRRRSRPRSSASDRSSRSATPWAAPSPSCSGAVIPTGRRAGPVRHGERFVGNRPTDRACRIGCLRPGPGRLRVSRRRPATRAADLLMRNRSADRRWATGRRASCERNDPAALLQAGLALRRFDSTAWIAGHRRAHRRSSSPRSTRSCAGRQWPWPSPSPGPRSSG